MEEDKLNNSQSLNTEWSQKKSKSKFKQIALGIVALVLVAGVAGAAYFVSNQLATKQGIALNAPESQPQASGNCGVKGCKKTETCGSDGRCRPKDPDPTGFGTGYTCTSSNCPGPCFSCNSGNTSCIAHPNAAGCGTVSTGVGSDSNNCGGTGRVCPDNTTCKNGQCETSTGATVTPDPNKTPTPVPPAGSIDQSGVKPNPCDGKNGRPICDQLDCHCLNGDDCGQSTAPGTSTDPGGTYKCDSELRQTCANQGRSWCLNQYGSGMTCCAAGYHCASGPGCVGSTPGTGQTSNPGDTSTPTKTPTKTPTATPTLTALVPACTEIKFFVPKANAGVACLADSDCGIANQPEGQFCLVSTKICQTWKSVSLAELSAQSRIGLPVKFSFTAINTDQLQVKVNQGSWGPTTKNPATGKFDYVYNITAVGTFNISARYLKP